MKVLLIEDNRELAHQIESVLLKARYVVDLAYDGLEGHFLGSSEHYDAVILDLGLPLLDGLTVLERWRVSGRGMPVLILTARQTWREKVLGLRAGADDYLAKPFEFEELLARIEALIRRSCGHSSSLLTCACGRVALDVGRAAVTLDGQPVELTALEYRVLEYLMQHAGEVVSKTKLTEHVYDQGFDQDSNVIEVLVSRLRAKLIPELIVTRRGLGYQLGGAYV